MEKEIKDIIKSHNISKEAHHIILLTSELSEIIDKITTIVISNIDLKQGLASNSASSEEPLCIECDGTGIVNYREIYYSFEHVEPVTCPACKDYKKQ